MLYKYYEAIIILTDFLSIIIEFFTNLNGSFLSIEMGRAFNIAALEKTATDAGICLKIDDKEEQDVENTVNDVAYVPIKE
jgi:hypothetical protein